MANTQKRIGDRTELEFERLARDLLGYDNIRRQLGAGRQDDQGDIAGIPDTCVQVTRCTRTNLPGRLTKKLGDVTVQAGRSGAAHRVVALRLERGPWRMAVPHDDPVVGFMWEWQLAPPAGMPLGDAVRWVPEVNDSGCALDLGDALVVTAESWAAGWKWWREAREAPLGAPESASDAVPPPTYHPDPRRPGESNVGGGE